MEEILREGFAALGVAMPEGAAAQLRRYWEILEERNKVMNLTAITGEEDCARLHFLDCGALLGAADLRGRRCLDVGSGAGFPGIVLKILEPTLELTMLDSQPMVKKGGLFVAMKGPAPEEELEEAAHAIRTLGAEVERVVKYAVPGTDAVHSAVLLRKSGPTPAQYPRRWAKMTKFPL